MTHRIWNRCALLSVVALICVGCGREGTRPAYQEVQLYVPDKPEIPADLHEVDVDLIASLKESREGLRNMPPAPEIPRAVRKNSDKAGRYAQQHAQREIKRNQLVGITETARVAYIVDQWMSELNQYSSEESESRLKHVSASEMGLAIPPLPQVFNLDSTREDLELQALLVARTEYSLGLIPSEKVLARAAAITIAWEEPLIERQSGIRRISDDMYGRTYRRLSRAQLRAKWQNYNSDLGDYYSRSIDYIRAQPYRVLTPEEERFIEGLK